MCGNQDRTEAVEDGRAGRGSACVREREYTGRLDRIPGQVTSYRAAPGPTGQHLSDGAATGGAGGQVDGWTGVKVTDHA